jgi:hypothetical protein
MLGFDANKTIQAAAYLLKREPGHRTNYMRLLKLLYLADRRSLETRCSPITGDTAYALPRGPVPSATLDMIKGNDPESTKWSEYIEKCGYDVSLVRDPGNLSLSRAELKILDALSSQFRDQDEWDLVNWCHANLPEFQKNDPEVTGDNSRRIPLDDILDAVGRLGDKDRIIDQINQDKGFAKLFGDHPPDPSPATSA